MDLRGANEENINIQNAAARIHTVDREWVSSKKKQKCRDVNTGHNIAE